MNDFHSAYGLDANPFRLTPDRRFRFLHSAYKRAADCVRRDIRSGAGIVMITGKPGTGKTTLVTELVAELDSAGARSAVLTSTQLDVDDLLRMIAQIYGLSPKTGDRTAVAAELDRFLQRQAEGRRRTVLIVDEAQNLSIDALEALGTLSTLRHDDRPLLEILLLGQEQLLDKLRDPALQPLTQRIVAREQLRALEANETRAYIEHRLQQAGWQGKPDFSDDAYTLIHVFSGGLPRYVNKLCARLLVYGSIDGKEVLDGDAVLTVGREMRDELLVPAFDDGDIASTMRSREPVPATGPEQQPADAAADSAPPPATAPAPAPAPADRPAAGAAAIDRAFRTPRTAMETGADSNRLREQAAAAPVADQTGAEITDNRQAKHGTRRPIDIALQATLALLILAVAYGSWRYRPTLPQAGRPTPAQPHVQTTPAHSTGAAPSMVPPAALSNHAPRGARSQPAPSPAGPATPEISGGAEPAGRAAPAQNPAPIAPPTPAASQLPQSSTAPPGHAPPAPRSAHQGRRREIAPSASPAAPGNGGVDTPPRPQAPAPNAAATPSDAAAGNAPSQLTLAALGAKAKAAFDAYCLTIPSNGSAYYYYRLMLARAPHNAQAHAGLQRIVQRYTWLARRALANRDYAQAGHYISRGLVVNPDDAQLLDLRHQLESQQPQLRKGKAPQAASPLFGRTHPNGGTALDLQPTAT